jgi:hypothetical protein
MARPTRNRRSTKHRGNAAGMIETRGRTGRKPLASEKGSATRPGASSSRATKRRNRYEKPPTWKGSATRGVIAAVFVYAVIALLNRHSSPVSELILVPVVLAIYIPLIHYTDNYMYRRQLRKKAGQK